jgi:hypothetical protein
VGADIIGEPLDDSGASIDISNDGRVLAVGAPRSAADDPGVVRVYRWDGVGWTPLGAPILGQVPDGQFGGDVALSADGRRVAVGNPNGSSSAPAVARVFEWVSTTSTWVQVGGDLDYTGLGGRGRSLALAADGGRLAVGVDGGDIAVFDWDPSVGAWRQIGADVVPPGTPVLPRSFVSMSAGGDRFAVGAGASDPELYGDSPALLYEWRASSAEWVQLGPPAPIDGADPGKRVALSASGGRLVVGVPRFGPPWVTSPGRAFVFDWDDARNTWSQVGDELVGPDGSSSFGESVAISASGGRLAVGAPITNAAATGLVRVYDWDPASLGWRQVGGDLIGAPTFGGNLAFSGDGSRLAIGARYEDANGIRSGVVRVFEIEAPTPSGTSPVPVLPATGTDMTWLRLGAVLAGGGAALLWAGQRSIRRTRPT